MLTTPAQRADFMKWFMPTFVIAFAFFLQLLINGASVAWAQVPAPGSTGVDFTPFAEQVIAVAVAVLTIMAGIVSKFAISKMASATKMQDSQFEALLADRVNDILLKSIDFAESWSKAQVADANSPLKNVEINNFFVEQAVKYAMRSMPDLIAYFKLTPDRLENMVRSRLNGVMGTPKADSGHVPHVLAEAA
jgi:hypothetical protein